MPVFTQSEKELMKLYPNKENDGAVEMDMGATGGPSETTIQVK